MSVMNDTAEEAESRTQRRRFESELFSLESDLGRLKRQREDMEQEIKRNKDSIRQLEASMVQKETARQSIEHNIGLTEMEISRAKKKINEL